MQTRMTVLGYVKRPMIGNDGMALFLHNTFRMNRAAGRKSEDIHFSPLP